MEFMRVLNNPDRCMQRLGFLKYLVWRSAQSATNDQATLGKELINGVSRKISVILTPQLQEYVRIALTDDIYKDLRAASSKTLDKYSDKMVVQVEIQDVYLANSVIQSRRGKLVKGDWRKYPYLAIDLGLVRMWTYSLLVRGQSFLSLVQEEERKAFGIQEYSNTDVNPFQLSPEQKLILLFSFIEKDGDVLSRLYSTLLSFSEPFTDRQAGDYLPEIYRSIAKESRKKARTGDDLQRIQRLLDTAGKIEEWKGKPYSGKGAREHAITPRLEPVVDLGLLSKPDPFAYRYQVTDATRKSFEPLINAESIDYFLHHSFFEAANKAFNLNAEHRTAGETILPAIQKAYVILKSPLGYVPILEVTLLAGIYSIIGSGYYFEISEATDMLKALQKERPELVRFNVDRWGALTFVKFNGDVMKVLGG